MLDLVGRHLPLVGTAQGAGDRCAHLQAGLARRSHHGREAGDALLDRAVDVLLAEGLAGSAKHHDLVGPLRAWRGDGGLDDDAGVVGEGGRQVDAAQHRVQRPAGDNLALVEQHQMVGEAGDFVGGVADVDDGNRQFSVQALKIGQDLQLALKIERGQRFVHQQDLRRGEQRPGNRHALAFAAGKLAGRAVEQVDDAEQFGDLGIRYLGHGIVQPGADPASALGSGKLFAHRFRIQVGQYPAAIGALVVDPRNPDVAWVFPMDGTDVWPRTSPEGKPAVYRTRDAGKTWERQDKGFPKKQGWFTVKRQAMTTDREEVVGVYFGTTSGEVWASADEGQRWTRIAAHLPEIYSVECA